MSRANTHTQHVLHSTMFFTEFCSKMYDANPKYKQEMKAVGLQRWAKDCGKAVALKVPPDVPKASRAETISLPPDVPTRFAPEQLTATEVMTRNARQIPKEKRVQKNQILQEERQESAENEARMKREREEETAKNPPKRHSRLAQYTYPVQECIDHLTQSIQRLVPTRHLSESLRTRHATIANQRNDFMAAASCICPMMVIFGISRLTNCDICLPPCTVYSYATRSWRL